MKERHGYSHQARATSYYPGMLIFLGVHSPRDGSLAICWYNPLRMLVRAQVSKNIIRGQQAGLLLLSSGDQPFLYSDHANISFIDNIVIGVQTTPIGVTSGSNINITGAALKSLAHRSDALLTMKHYPCKMLAT